MAYAIEVWKRTPVRERVEGIAWVALVFALGLSPLFL